MARIRRALTLEQFQIFYAAERAVYSLLICELCRDPFECLQVLALWIWLEQVGFNKITKKIWILPHSLVNEVTEEALMCLRCSRDPRFFFSALVSDIPLTQTLMDKEISIEFFHINCVEVVYGVRNIMSDVCFAALGDIMEETVRKRAARLNQGPMMIPPAVDQSLVHRLSSMCLGETSQARTRTNEVSRDDRTMFITFSKGYPVLEWEVREFLNHLFGDCIESFFMPDVLPEGQALFAQVVFYHPWYISTLLNGLPKVKYVINGKHAWMRKFEPRRPISTT